MDWPNLRGRWFAEKHSLHQNCHKDWNMKYENSDMSKSAQIIEEWRSRGWKCSRPSTCPRVGNVGGGGWRDWGWGESGWVKRNKCQWVSNAVSIIKTHFLSCLLTLSSERWSGVEWSGVEWSGVEWSAYLGFPWVFQNHLVLIWTELWFGLYSGLASVPC